MVTRTLNSKSDSPAEVLLAAKAKEMLCEVDEREGDHGKLFIVYAVDTLTHRALYTTTTLLEVYAFLEGLHIGRKGGRE